MIATALTLAAAAGIHLAMIASHYAESFIIGSFFGFASAMQFVQAIQTAQRPSRFLLLSVAFSNLLLIAAWAVSRTVGIPLGRVEGVGVLDASAVVLEIVAVFGASRAVRGYSISRSNFRKLSATVAVAIVTLATGAVSSATSLGDSNHAHERSKHTHVDEFRF